MSESARTPPFQNHHVITQDVVGKSKLLAKLKELGFFDQNVPQNRLKLPATQELAEKLNVSPHTGGPLSSYQEGVAKQIQSLADTPDGLNACWRPSCRGTRCRTNKYVARYDKDSARPETSLYKYAEEHDIGSNEQAQSGIARQAGRLCSKTCRCHLEDGQAGRS